MILSRLELYNFRNYQHLDIELFPGVNLIIGRNAQGKTNLLESVYFLSHLKSRRAPRMRDLALEGTESASARGLIIDRGQRISLKAGIGAGGRSAEINGRRAEQASRAIGIMKCVMFEPGDLYLVKGEPLKRREFLDETMEGIGPVEAYEVGQYRHLLRQRNAMMKRWEEYGKGFLGALEPWNERLAEYGGAITGRRLRMVSRMSSLVTGTYREVSGEDTPVSFEYRGSFALDAGAGVEAATLAMREALEAALGEEKRSRKTIVGPHRDEVEIKIGGREARYQASQGEQRTIAFAMRFAQKEYTREVTGRGPVLLLDDVLSELDEARRERVIEMAAGCEQALLTATEAPRGAGIPTVRKFEVEGGKIKVG